jgi:zeta-carotene desaturase
MMRSLALAALAATAVALAPPGAPRTLKTRRQAVVSEPDAKAKVSSANAKRQVGNDAFLNKDLRARARGGTGVVNDAKLKIGIVGAGLAGMVCAMDLADAGHDVEIFELRPFVGGKVSSWKDKEGNHIEMGLHVFFGCYYNLFGIMERTGSYDLLRMKEHIHTFVNKGGELGALDFRFPVGAPVSGLQAFARTEQLGWGDKAANALRLGTSPIVRALVDFDGGMDMVVQRRPCTGASTARPPGTSRKSEKRPPTTCSPGDDLARPYAIAATPSTHTGPRPRRHHVHRMVHELRREPRQYR